MCPQAPAGTPSESLVEPRTSELLVVAQCCMTTASLWVQSVLSIGPCLPGSTQEASTAELIPCWAGGIFSRDFQAVGILEFAYGFYP